MESPRSAIFPYADDTICAVATAPDGALGIIRISGPQAIDILSQVFTKDLSGAQPNTLHHGYITSSNEVVDEVVVSVFRAPHSYTGEDSIEISCHGSRYIINKVLEFLVENGCRVANPGEFTQRAFLNGKMDLSQAEAVADLIASNSTASHHMAMSQMRGNISTTISQLREQLLNLTTLLELELDFADHEELEFADRNELLKLTKKIETHIDKLTQSFQTGQALKLGIPVAIVGKTNVGKSTLLNRLLKEDRAIVSDIHGTTRDTIEDTILIRGVQFRFIDTAGLRETVDEVEQIGIQRTYAAIDKARIVLWLYDQEPSEDEIRFIQTLCEGKKLLVIQNKVDLIENTLPQATSFDDNTNEGTSEQKLFTFDNNRTKHSKFLRISAKHGTNIEELEQAIYDSANIPEFNDGETIITNARHYAALNNALAGIRRVEEGFYSNIPSDLIAEDLRIVLSSLGEITGGTISSQETLNNIFNNFCVGK